MVVSIVTLSGAGVGTSEVLRVTALRALDRLGIEAILHATDVAHVAAEAADAQVILSTEEHAPAARGTFAEVIVVSNILDVDELTAKLAAALQ